MTPDEFRTALKQAVDLFEIQHGAVVEIQTNRHAQGMLDASGPRGFDGTQTTTHFLSARVECCLQDDMPECATVMLYGRTSARQLRWYYLTKHTPRT